MVTIAESQFALPATAPALSLIKEAKAHPGSIMYRIDPDTQTITNYMLISHAPKGGNKKSSGTSKGYHSVIMPSELSSDFNSLHLMPRCITGMSGDKLNVYASVKANLWMTNVEKQLGEWRKSNPVLYVVQVQVDRAGMMTIVQVAYHGTTGKKLHHGQYEDKTTKYEFVADETRRAKLPTVTKMTKAGLMVSTRVPNPFYGGLSEDKIRELIRASRLEPVFAPEEVVATPVEFTTKPKAKPGRKPQISSDLRMLDVLIKELGERKLKPSEKQYLKGQITTLMNLL